MLFKTFRCAVDGYTFSRRRLYKYSAFSKLTYWVLRSYFQFDLFIEFISEILVKKFTLLASYTDKYFSEYAVRVFSIYSTNVRWANILAILKNGVTLIQLVMQTRNNRHLTCIQNKNLFCRETLITACNTILFSLFKLSFNLKKIDLSYKSHRDVQFSSEHL